MPGWAGLVAMACAGVLAWRSRRAGAALLALSSAVFLLTNKSFEGPRLIKFSVSHGLVLTDLIGLGGIVLATYLWVASGREAHR